MPRTGDHGELSATARARDISPQRLWQRRQVAAGHCASCSAKRKRYTWFCDDCQARDNAASQARVERLRAQGRCRCGQPNGGHRRCDDCRARENRARRKA